MAWRSPFTTGATYVMGREREIPYFVYIAGCDGTGKSTQAELLLSRLQSRGLRPLHLWLRFPFVLSTPLLAYARWMGYSWYEEVEGTRYGYWDFRQSPLLRSLFPWLLLVDAALTSVFYVHLPLRLAKTIVCERFVLDMLVDLTLALDDPLFHRRLPGKLFLELLPPKGKVVILDLDIAAIRRRRSDLRHDRQLVSRRHRYRLLAGDLSLPVLSSRQTIPEVSELIWNLANVDKGS